MRTQLQPGEQLLWQGQPAMPYAWGDHDLLQSPRYTPMKPDSIGGRILMSLAVAVALILVALLGTTLAFMSSSALLHSASLQEFSLYLLGVLLGLVMLCPVPMLFKPLANRQRTKRLYYLLTNRRVLILRLGGPGLESALRLPSVFSVSLFCLLTGIVTLTGAFMVVFGNIGQSEFPILMFVALSLGFILLAGLGGLFLFFGWNGLRLSQQMLHGLMHTQDRVDVRAFDLRFLDPTALNIKRLRSNGVGDLIFDQDSYFEPPSGKDQGTTGIGLQETGLLSLPHVQQVTEQIRQAVLIAGAALD